MRRVEDNVHDKAHNHYAYAVDSERQRKLAEQVLLNVFEIPAPLAVPLAGVDDNASCAAETGNAVNHGSFILLV